MSAYFQTDDGCRIAFDYRIRDERPTLLLSPSLGTAMALFEPQVEALGDHFSILRYDPRGHGRSDAPPGATSLDRLGRDAIELLDHLGIARAHILGVSLGGMVAQWIGFRAPARAGLLVLANTSAYIGPPADWAGRIAVVAEGGMEAVADAVIERWFTEEFRRGHPERVAHARTMLAATAPAGYAASCAAIRDMDMRASIRLIDRPTLVIGGTHDPATPIEHAKLLAASISGARLVELPAAHLANLEQSYAFNAEVAQFLAEAA